jgi:hypothetical protein
VSARAAQLLARRGVTSSRVVFRGTATGPGAPDRSDHGGAERHDCVLVLQTLDGMTWPALSLVVTLTHHAVEVWRKRHGRASATGVCRRSTIKAVAVRQPPWPTASQRRRSHVVTLARGETGRRRGRRLGLQRLGQQDHERLELDVGGGAHLLVRAVQGPGGQAGLVVDELGDLGVDGL